MVCCIKRMFNAFVFFFSLPLFASSLQYAVIIDAGSSGSRAHVFQYAKALPLIPIPIITDVFNKSITPGLSFYKNDPTAAGPSLKPILDASALYLQQQGVNLSQVPISVLATAGMRLLTPSEQAAIYDSVRSYIHSNYAFSLNDANVRTITGQQEGLFGWLDVNYLSKSFIHPAATVGSIDMGGASTQIAFATSDTSQPENEVVITINHRPYRVFTQSFLGLGQNQARNAMTAYAYSPTCYPSGYNYPISQTGMFNFDPCSAIYTGIIQDHNVAENIISTAGQSFIAYSGIYNNYSFFNILQTPTQSALQSQINANCYLSWDQLQIHYPDSLPAFLSNYCADAVYFDDLLYNTYQLQGYQLTVTNTINGTGLDWTLGALFYSLIR